MDAKAGDTQNPPAPSSVPESQHEALSEPVVAGDSGKPVESDGREDDEQVERFYALLANVRALRGMYSGGVSSQKRARAADQSWRPAFRMEDFRDDAGCARKKQRREQPEKASAEEEGEIVQENKRVPASQRGIESKA